jgi:pimeloyl-ACP methyl ester carboxylesterase
MSGFSSKGGRVKLTDGRSLGYAEYGDGTGRPVLCFPGTPSSRLLHPLEGPTSSLGVRLIVVERPGFQLEDISIPVYLWHGEADANVSISAARHVAQTIPKCRTTFLCGKGHWLFLEHWEEILRSVLC